VVSDLADALQEAIRKLRQDNIIYIWQDRAMNALKLGLKKGIPRKTRNPQLEALIKKVEEML